MTKKVHHKTKSHKHGISNNINIHIHEHDKHHKKTKRKRTKKKSHVEGVNMHYPLVMPAPQPFVIHPPPYNYDNRPPPPNQQPGSSQDAVLKGILKQFTDSQQPKTTNSIHFHDNVNEGVYNARVTVKKSEDGSSAEVTDMYTSGEPKSVLPDQVIAPEWVTPVPEAAPTTTNLLLKNEPEPKTVEMNNFGDIYGDQINSEQVIDNPLLKQTPEDARTVSDANLREIRNTFLDKVENDMKEANKKANLLKEASELLSIIQGESKIKSAKDFSDKQWKSYRHVMEKVGHSVTNKQVKRETLLTNMEKYSSLFEEEEQKKKQKEKDYEKEKKAKYGPGKTTVQTIYDNAGYIAGAVGGAVGSASVYNLMPNQAKKALMKVAVNAAVGAQRYQNVRNHPVTQAVTQVLGVNLPDLRNKKTLQKERRRNNANEDSESYWQSSANIENGRGNILESFSNQMPTNAGLDLSRISPTSSEIEL